MLIKSYGLYWRAEYVDWGHKGPGGQGHLWGQREQGELRVDHWHQMGIYVLYHAHLVVYVGKATTLGTELRARRRSLAGRWDTFSWLGLRDTDDQGNLTETAVNFGVQDTLDELEAILCNTIEPSLNRQVPRLPSSAKRFNQELPDESLQQRLATLEEKIRQLAPQSQT